MSNPIRSGRLSILAAAYVIARRDFTAILFSRSFFFFLLGPLFPVVVGAMAGGIGAQVKNSIDRPELGIAMAAADVDAMLAAHKQLVPHMGRGIPDLVVVSRLEAGALADPKRALAGTHSNLAAIVTGTPAAPVLTGTPSHIESWQGPLELIAAQALGRLPPHYPKITLSATATSTADQNQGRLATAQAGQTVLFLLTMLLAGMVLSNLVEEKGNKIIEILAAAIPMDAVFFGKLFAMLAVSLVGVAVWTTAGAAIGLLSGDMLSRLPVPAVGWPMFFALGVAYFSMAYLLLGSVFLAIGSMATTVREVQTMSMPVTMLQLLVFFFASFAIAKPGSGMELAAMIVPFSSPYAMLASAAQHGALLPHAAALAWQALCVAIFIRTGAKMFRTRVMKSGQAGGSTKKRGLFRRATDTAVEVAGQIPA